MNIERTTEIIRVSGQGFGFSVIGGSDTILPPMVCALVQDGPASDTGELLVGDVIVKVNGLEVGALPTKKVVDLIRNSPNKIVLTVKDDKNARLKALPFLSENTVTDAPEERVLRAKVRRNTSSPVPIENRRSGGSPTRAQRIVGSPNYDHLGTDGKYALKGSLRINKQRDQSTVSDGHYSDPDYRTYNRRPNSDEYYTHSPDRHYRQIHHDSDGGYQGRDPPPYIERGQLPNSNFSRGYPDYITSSQRSPGQGGYFRDKAGHESLNNYNDLMSQISGHVDRRQQFNTQQSGIPNKSLSNDEKLDIKSNDMTCRYTDASRTEMGRNNTYRQGSQSEEKLDYRYYNGTNTHVHLSPNDRVVGRGTGSDEYNAIRTAKEQSQSYRNAVPNIITSGNGYKNYYSDEMLESNLSRNPPSGFMPNINAMQHVGNNSTMSRSAEGTIGQSSIYKRNREPSSPTRRNVMYESYIGGGECTSPSRTNSAISANQTSVYAVSDNTHTQGTYDRKRDVSVTRSSSLGRADRVANSARADPRGLYKTQLDTNFYRSSSYGKGTIKMNVPISSIASRDRNSLGEERTTPVVTGHNRHNSAGDAQNAIMSRSDVDTARYNNSTSQQKLRLSSDMEGDLGIMLRDISPDKTFGRGIEVRNSYDRNKMNYKGNERIDGGYSSKFCVESNSDSTQYSEYSSIPQTQSKYRTLNGPLFNLATSPGSGPLNEPIYYRSKSRIGPSSDNVHVGERKRPNKDSLGEISPADLATRLFTLDGFTQEEVSPLLGKNTDFSQEVCKEYLKYLNFQGLTLDDALRQFLNKFQITGETQERERILDQFSKRYYECNKPNYGSEDAIHTLTCAMMLLNTDLHGQNIGTKMTLNEFINNTSGLCDGGNFPKDLLKTFYQSIKNRELLWTGLSQVKEQKPSPRLRMNTSGGNPFIEIKADIDAVVMKKGMMYRKCLMDSDGRRTPAIKRGWKMFHCVLKGLVLFLHKPDGEPDQFQTIGIHHTLAGFAAEYKKRPFVFKLITADWRVYMFQSKNKLDVQEWVDSLNLSAAALSAPPLPAPVCSSKRFQKPVMPVATTRLRLEDQIKRHQERVENLGQDLEEHRHIQRGEMTKDHKEWESKMDYLEYEHKRFTSYVNVLTVPRLQETLVFLLSNKNNKRKSDTMVNHNTQPHDEAITKRSNSMTNLRGSSSSPDSRRRVRESYFMAVNG